MWTFTEDELAQLLNQYVQMHLLGGDDPKTFLQEAGYIPSRKPQVRSFPGLFYRRKQAQALIEAVCFDGTNADHLAKWVQEKVAPGVDAAGFTVFESFRVRPGDWVVKGAGYFHTYSDHEFRTTFEAC